jgi:hypothetical protein
MPDFNFMWFNKASAMRQGADDIVSKALRDSGWKHTSSTPGSRWMWQKEIDGRVYSVGRDEAERLQEHADRQSYFALYPDEMGD